MPKRHCISTALQSESVKHDCSASNVTCVSTCFTLGHEAQSPEKHPSVSRETIGHTESSFLYWSFHLGRQMGACVRCWISHWQRRMKGRDRRQSIKGVHVHDRSMQYRHWPLTAWLICQLQESIFPVQAAVRGGGVVTSLNVLALLFLIIPRKPITM